MSALQRKGKSRLSASRPSAADRGMLRSNIWITPSGILDRRHFRWAIEVVGAERIKFSAHYPCLPWDNGPGRSFLEAAGLSRADRERIACGNWNHLCTGIRRTRSS